MRQWHWVAWSISGVMSCLLASGASGSTIRQLTYFEPANVSTGFSGGAEVLVTMAGDEAGCRFYAGLNSGYPYEFVQLKITDPNPGQSVTRTLASDFEISFDVRLEGLAAGVDTAPVTIELRPPVESPSSYIARTFNATAAGSYTLNLAEFTPAQNAVFQADSLDDTGLGIQFHLYSAQTAFGVETDQQINRIWVDNIVLRELPEPGSVGLLAVASLVALRRRRR